MGGLAEAKASIMSAGTIAVAGHLNPDGDSVGSLLSLGLGLEKLGKRVYMVNYDRIPMRYKKLPGALFSIIEELSENFWGMRKDC